jgi:toxin-antitoxin system PIN domain toxin
VLVLDVNVVLAAHREDHPHHGVVRPWLEAVIASRDSYAVPHAVLASFLRLATNRRIFPVPTPLADAFEFLEALSAQPGFLPAEPGPRHLTLLRSLCEEFDAQGDLLPDTVIAAIALEHAGAVATLDRDFARFTNVRVVRPAPAPLSS